MDFSKSSRVCLNVDRTRKCCDKQHFMNYQKDSIKEYYVMNTYDFVDLWRHHTKNLLNKNVTTFVQKKKIVFYLKNYRN